MREKLDQIGKQEIDISINCDITPEGIAKLVETEDKWLASKSLGNNDQERNDDNEKIKERRLVQVLGIGRFIASAKPFKVEANIKEIDGNIISKRGIVPGYTVNKRLQRINIRK